MDKNQTLRQRIQAASGAKKAELVLKHASIVNVFTCELETADIAIEKGYIVGLGQYDGEREVDLKGKTVCPGFIDGHIHLESSMVSPADFQQAVMPHGTTAVITDPHEIANVAGTAGIEYMMKYAEVLDLDVYFMLPSCVPATGLDEAGAVLEARELRPFYERKEVLGLAELMNAFGTIQADEAILDKLADARENGRLADGHAPFLSGRELNAYVTAGVVSDHECSQWEEAREKLSRGQWIMVREGTAARNLNALMPMFQYPYCERGLLVTDDKHPGDLIRLGHIDYIIKRAVEQGADPILAIRMGSYNAARYFGLKDRGAIAPGYRADLAVLSELKTFQVEQVYKDGRLVAEDGEFLGEKPHRPILLPEMEKRVYDSFHMPQIRLSDLEVKETGENQRVICLQDNELLTREMIFPWKEKEGYAPGVDLDRDIIKMAVFERHHETGHMGLGFLHGYGLKKGAVASSIAHDSHNLIVVGTNDADMVLAGNCVRENKGGLAIAVDGKVQKALPLPIGGLMTDAPAEVVEQELQEMKEQLKAMGIPDTIDAFMTLAFVSLPVIPKLRLNTFGVIDADAQTVVKAVF